MPLLAECLRQAREGARYLQLARRKLLLPEHWLRSPVLQSQHARSSTYMLQMNKRAEEVFVTPEKKGSGLSPLRHGLVSKCHRTARILGDSTGGAKCS